LFFKDSWERKYFNTLRRLFNVSDSYADKPEIQFVEVQRKLGFSFTKRYANYIRAIDIPEFQRMGVKRSSS
jgi:hypothetical protein